MDLREFRSEARTNGSRHPWELARVEVVSRLLARSLGRAGIGGILDLGCGDTFCAEQLAERLPGCSIAAVDTAFDAATKATLRARLTEKPITLYDSLDEAQRHFPSQVGLVLLLDVMEHVADDAGLLRSLRRYPFIRRDAWVLITVPAYPSLFSSHDRFLGHYRRYTNRTLADCAERAGYRVHQAGYFFSSLLLPRYLAARRERRRGAPAATSDLLRWKGGAFRTALLRHALLLDFETSWGLKRLGLKLPGLSNYLLCQSSA